MKNLIISLLSVISFTMCGQKSESLSTEKNVMVEWKLHSVVKYENSFNDIDLDVVIKTPSGKKLVIPAFWAGGDKWKIRYSSNELGVHSYITNCSDDSNESLHEQKGEIEVSEYKGNNELYIHGPLKIANDKRHFAHSDNTPFFWLGDTWWMALSKRLHWPKEFKSLVDNRKEIGFNVIQIVVGFYPDNAPFDERTFNEGGSCWDSTYKSINPKYFDFADRRLEYIVSNGIMPSIFGSWGYHMKWMRKERFKKHWRYLIARYGAMPVTWCAAGETGMPYYLPHPQGRENKEQMASWTEIIKYIKDTDPYKHLVTTHPLWRSSARQNVTDASVLDFDMLQTGHDGRESLFGSMSHLHASYWDEPKMPVINSEVCYEELGDKSHADVQRLMFWSSILSGAAGHSYGANGIWQINRNEKPFGSRPDGQIAGNKPSWNDAMKLPGAKQLGIAKQMLEKYQWSKLKPNPFSSTYSAGIPGKVRIVYLPTSENATIHVLEKELKYNATYFDPITGDFYDAGTMAGDKYFGSAPIPITPKQDQDWVLVLEANKK